MSGFKSHRCVAGLHQSESRDSQKLYHFENFEKKHFFKLCKFLKFELKNMGETNEITVEKNVVEASPIKSQILSQYKGYFKGKTIVITGARQGLGREMAKLFNAEGAKVYAVSRFPEHLKTLKERYPGVIPIACNLKNWKDTEEEMNAVLEGSVDFLVNNAEELIREDFLHATQYGFDRVLDVNVKGLLSVSKIIADNMIKGGKGGSIVNISSLASTSPSLANDLFPYCASKAAADMITRCLAVELGQYGIRVNSVNPTIVVDDFRKDFWVASEKSKEQAETLAKLTPLGRFAKMEDVVQAVAFLLSDKANMITGQILKIDGGYTAR